ncbi:hypothetical protein ACFL0V_06600 [Nanoarchaeota archaeon]
MAESYSPAQAQVFCDRVREYVEQSLPEISDDDLEAATESRKGVSNCQSGPVARTFLAERLEERKFFTHLDTVYTTLEIVASMTHQNRKSLKGTSVVTMGAYVQGQLVAYEAKVRKELERNMKRFSVEPEQPIEEYLNDDAKMDNLIVTKRVGSSQLTIAREQLHKYRVLTDNLRPSYAKAQELLRP